MARAQCTHRIIGASIATDEAQPRPPTQPATITVTCQSLASPATPPDPQPVRILAINNVTYIGFPVSINRRHGMRRAQPVTLNTAQCKRLRPLSARRVKSPFVSPCEPGHGIENKPETGWRTRFLESGLRPTARSYTCRHGTGAVIHKTTREKLTGFSSPIRGFDREADSISIRLSSRSMRTNPSPRRGSATRPNDDPDNQTTLAALDSSPRHAPTQPPDFDKEHSICHPKHPRFNHSSAWLSEISPSACAAACFRSSSPPDYIAQHNEHPTPFIWTATASDILEKVKRGRAALHKVQSA